ncbi:MAG: hypothetical protein IPO59_14955 [Betaproteobacteria bacterium]|nr:hypothetical protein [Betaproteobacteria bacterium]
MFGQIPFGLPLRFLPGLASGDIVRYGAILKEAGTGRILGHLQESGIAQSLLSQALSSATSPLSLASSVVNTGSSIYTAVQVRQLKAMMETLQALQVATLGVSLVGVGVSVAGFLYMRKRFNSLDGRLDRLIDAVEAGFENLERSGSGSQMLAHQSLVQRAELARSMIDPPKEYKEVAASWLNRRPSEGEIVFQISTKSPINHDTFWLFAQLWMLCNSVRVDCQIRANELLNAQHVSERIGPASFNTDHLEGRATVKILRDATDSAHSKPFLLDYLRTRRIEGPAYLDSLEREKEQSMLVLPAI